MQHNDTSAMLEDKRNECLRKQSEMHYLEEKFNTSTMAIQDKISRELKVIAMLFELNIQRGWSYIHLMVCFFYNYAG